jgi:hypothetical protein
MNETLVFPLGDDQFDVFSPPLSFLVCLLRRLRSAPLYAAAAYSKETARASIFLAQVLFRQRKRRIQNIENEMSREIEQYEGKVRCQKRKLAALHILGWAAFIVLVLTCLWFIKHII